MTLSITTQYPFINNNYNNNKQQISSVQYSLRICLKYYIFECRKKSLIIISINIGIGQFSIIIIDMSIVQQIQSLLITSWKLSSAIQVGYELLKNLSLIIRVILYCHINNPHTFNNPQIHLKQHILYFFSIVNCTSIILLMSLLRGISKSNIIDINQRI